MAERMIWLTGDWQAADFADALSWLRQQARLLPHPSPHPHPLPMGEGTVLHAILFAQSRPGQFARDIFERWQVRAPQARQVALLGPWCEGQERSGKRCPGVSRVSWSNWTTRLPLALGLDSAGIRPSRTTTEADRLQAELQMLSSHCRVGLAAIRTDRHATFESLRLALRACGLTAQWAAEVNPHQADVEFIDGWEHWPEVAGPPRVLVLQFPRPDDLNRATQLGAAAVLTQPLLLVHLAAVLARLISPAQSRPALPSVA